MSSINLGKLLKKRQFAPIITRLIAVLATPVLIKDIDNVVLMATEGSVEGRNYPVNVQGETIGYICGDEKTALLASLLSYHADIEFERKNLGNETLHKYKEITLLYEMADRIPACMDRKEIAAYLIEQIRQVITFSAISLFLWDKETGLLETIYSDGNEFLTGSQIAPKGILGSVFKSGKGEIVNDVTSDSRFVGEASSVSSLMCAPLKSKESITGVVKLINKEPVMYTAADLKLFTTLASQAAIQIENSALYLQLKNAFYAMVYTLADTIEKRDPYTGNHTKRVMEYSLALGKTLQLSEHELTRLELAAVLHDVGKIGVPDSVLLKESKLTDDEFRQIKLHTTLGAEILSKISQLNGILPGVRHHHERFDGRGYPDGLSGNQIDISARIIAVADSFDAMTTDRPYRKGFAFEEAFEELRKYKGTQFDPDVVDAFFASDVMEAYFTANSKIK